MPVRHRPEFEPAELPKARMVRWWVFSGAAALLALAFLVLPYWLTVPADAPVGASFTMTVALFSGFIVSLLFMLYGIGRARLEIAAYNANEVDIELFEIDGDSSPAEVTAVFKSKLNESRMYTPAVVPGVSRSYDFIQIVESAGEAATGWWRVASRLIRLARPPHAIRISGRLRTRDGQHQLVLEVVRQPGFAASPLLLTDDDEQRLLGRAANAVAALVIPRSKYCRNQQWARWRGAKIPGALFDAYERANQYKTERRYDEALAEYHRAIELDPANVHIRVEIGNLQERLDLHLAALVTYDDVVTLCENRKYGPSTPEAAALLLARYRRALVLGRGDWLAHDWWLGDPKTRMRQIRMRESIQLRFERYRETLPPPEGLLDDPDGSTNEVKAARLRAYFCEVAQYELEKLIAEPRPKHLRQLLSDNCLRLGLLATHLRRSMAHAEMGAPLGGYSAVKNVSVDGFEPLAADPDWPPSVDALTEVVRQQLQPRGPASVWHEHYNAACVYAVALLPSGMRGEPSATKETVRTLGIDEKKTLVTKAIAELDSAAASRHTGYLAQRRPWVMSEDPDLSTLRGQPEFRTFEMITYSPDRPTPLRPRRVHAWELSTHTATLVRHIASCLAHAWRRYTPQPKEFVDELAADTWHRAEHDAWETISQLASANQEWQTRYQAIKALQRWSHASGYACDDIRFPAYSEHSLFTRAAGLTDDLELRKEWQLPQGEDTVNKETELYLRRCAERLVELSHLLRVPRHDVVVPRTRKDFQQAAETWAALADWFADGDALSPVSARRARFERAFRR
ncbi:tetratricopeptide repeat protein [Amycolatopsis magusensis]|uniref:tetratricopeptide repeat protein n=1 Tax=Amycolatopsis magusensis TaxID=882444 RepID=UPI003C2E2B2E